MQLNKVAELGNFIRDQRRTARLSLRKLSTMAGISNPYLSQIERGLRRPSAEILQAIAKALRISAETLYVKAGILEDRGDSTDPVTSILRDLSLNDKQKQALIEIYQSFQHENDGEVGGAVALAKPRPKATKASARAAAKKTGSRSTAKKRSATAKKKPKATKAAAKKSASKRSGAAKKTRKKTAKKSTRGTATRKRSPAKRATRTAARKRR